MFQGVVAVDSWSQRSPTTAMAVDDDEVEFVALHPAGPSSPRRRAQPHRRLLSSSKRKAGFAAPHDIIEIHDSDEEELTRPAAKRKGKGRAIEVWRDKVGTADVPRKTPLFLPDDDSDSDVDVQGLLEASDPPASSPVQAYLQLPTKDKGKGRPRPAALDRIALQEGHSPSPGPLPPSTNLSLASIMPEDPTARIATQVLEILPDIEQGYLQRLIQQHIQLYNAESDGDRPVPVDDEQIMQSILHVLFELPNYPKAFALTQPTGSANPSGDPPGTPSRSGPPGHAVPRAAPLERALNHSTQSEQDVSRLLEPGPSDLGGSPVLQPAVPAASSSGQKQPSPPPVAPEPERDPASVILAQVLEIIPDVEPTHAATLIKQHLERLPLNEDGEPSDIDVQGRALQGVLHMLFENPNYPKVSKKRKRSPEDEGEGASKPTKAKLGDGIDYASQHRERKGGKHYDQLALHQLVNDFPELPHEHIYVKFNAHNQLYAPTFLYLRAENRGTGQPSAVSGASPSKDKKKKKGKGKAAQRSDPEFERERAWLIRKLVDDAANGVVTIEEDEGEGFECGCCFSSYPFNKMTQCPDAHLFCVDCVTHYAETLLGEHNPAIACMDQSGCKLLFTQSELRRILSPKLIELYERVTQRKELQAAGLENLEECPFCEYQVVIENEQEKLFRCEREDCGAVSCRKCKKLDHLPKSCEEVAEDKKLDARHAIEEAMTAALMRNCPKCNKAFIKEAGCNKMVCPNCRTMSCYVCRQIITGYEHFNQAPPYKTAKDPKKCQLWDSVEERHADEVAAAAKRAQEEVKRANPDVADADLAVALPPPPPKQAGCGNPHCPHHHPAPAHRGPAGFAPLPPAVAPANGAFHALGGIEGFGVFNGVRPLAQLFGGPPPMPINAPPPPYVPRNAPPPPPPPAPHQYRTRARGPVPPAPPPALPPAPVAGPAQNEVNAIRLREALAREKKRQDAETRALREEERLLAARVHEVNEARMRLLREEAMAREAQMQQMRVQAVAEQARVQHARQEANEARMQVRMRQAARMLENQAAARRARPVRAVRMKQ